MLRRGLLLGRWVCIGFALASLGAGKSSKTETRPEPVTIPCSPLLLPSMAPPIHPTQSIPSPAEQDRAEKLVRQTFAKEFQATSITDRLQLAQRLLHEGSDTTDDPAARYVLWRDARDLAASAGDAILANRALQRLSEQYIIELPSTLLATLVAANRSAITSSQAAAVAQSALLAVDQCVAFDDYDTATRLANIASGAAIRSKIPTLVARAAARAKELELSANQFTQLKSATARLRENPDDPEANLAAGAFLSFVKCDWDKGLPRLAKGSDPVLKILARADLDASSDHDRAMQANQWWDQSLTRSGLVQRHIQAHAVTLYKQSLASLSGITLDSARARITRFDASILKDLGLEVGLLAEFFKGTDFSHRVTSRIDSQLDFDWGAAAPDPLSPKDNFSIRFSGTLLVPQPGRYEIILIANSGAKVYLGEKLILDGSDIARKRSGISAPVDFPDVLTTIRVDYWDTSGLAKVRLLWRTPQSSQDAPIPPSALFHDVSLKP